MQTTTQVATTQLGSTGLGITAVGFGAGAIGGGGWEFGWEPHHDDEAIAAIHRALELGVNWIDTAPGAGFGRAEQVVGRALAGLSEKPLVFTKASVVEGPGGLVAHSLKRDSIRRQVEASLTRLGVDAIDLYQLNWPKPEKDLEEGWFALEELKHEGLVRHIGVCNFDVRQMQRIQSIAPIETLRVPYSLIARDVEQEILPFAEREGIGVLVYSPMGSGLLSGKLTRQAIAKLHPDDWRKYDARFRAPRLRRNLAAAARVREIADRVDASPAAVAIAWTLCHRAVHGAIAGLRRPDQVDDLLMAARNDLCDEAVGELSVAAEAAAELAVAA
jgi:aryl-alcohol dehydrogenase-like predicted oxidoreductase